MQHPPAEATDDSEDKDEVDEDGEEDDSVDEDIGEDSGDRKSRPSSCLIVRTITLQMLLEDGLLEPGEGAMSIEYMGQRFVGDLLSDGKIRSQETDIVFATPSAWAVNCRRIINPVKKSGCGWASIRYKGRKLDGYKNIWINRRNEERKKLCAEVDDYDSGVEKENTMLAPPPPPPITSCGASASSSVPTTGTVTISSPATSTTATVSATSTPTTNATVTTAIPTAVPKPVRMPVKHHTIGSRTSMHDPNMLVEGTSFSALGKIQPFLVSMSTNAVLVMDFHCHLTTSEVCGYLAGHWDVNAHNLSITTAFPCRSRLDDPTNGPQVEKEIRKEIEQKGLIPVGWYHSHPMLPATPSLRDIDKQLDHEMHMKGSSDSSYTPCIAVICSPYYGDTSNIESSIVGFWVAPPPENKPLEYGKPMLMSYSVSQDGNLPPEVVKEMTALVEFYKDMHDFIDFNKVFKGELTYLEKLKATLTPKFPRDQTDGVLWGFIRQLVTPGSEEQDSDGNIKIYKPETTIVTTTASSISTTTSSASPLVVPVVQVGGRNSSSCSSVNSNCHGSVNSTSSSTNTANNSGFFLGSDMTSAILAAGKLPAGTSLMSVLPGNSQNMFLSPLGLNMLGGSNSNMNKGCKTGCSGGSNMSNLATLSNLSNMGNLGNLSIANLANLNNLTLSNLGNLSNLASISLSNKNTAGCNVNSNSFRSNLSVSMTNASSHTAHVTSTSSVSHSSANCSAGTTVSSSNSSPVCSVSSVKSNINTLEKSAPNDIVKKHDPSASAASANAPKEESSAPKVNSSSQVISNSVNNSTSANTCSTVNAATSASNSPSLSNTACDINGKKSLNCINSLTDKSSGNQVESDAERPAKMAKLDTR